MNRYVAGILVWALVIGGPQMVRAQNAGVAGTVDVRVMAHATTTLPFEYIGIRFTTTGTLPLNLTGFTIHDETGLRYTFPSYQLPGETEVVVCQTNADATASGWCDLYSGGSSVWNNEGDTFMLYDEDETLLTSFEVGGLGPETEATISFELDYPTPETASLEITNPPEDGLTLTGSNDFEVVVAGDEAETPIDWQLLSGECETGTLVSARATAAPNSYADTGTDLVVTIDTDTLQNGTYCFVSEREMTEEADFLRAERTFVVERYIEPRYVVTGFSYHDVDGDGHYVQAIDTVLADRVVTARAVGSEDFLATTTDEFGAYRLTLRPGTWIVSEAVPNPWQQTGVIENKVEIYSTVQSLATTTLRSCTARLDVTEESGFVIGQTCDFLSASQEVAVATPIRGKSRGAGEGTKVGHRNQPIPHVLGVASTTSSCGQYLTAYLGPTWANPPAEVQKLQLFLTSHGWLTPLTGRYDEVTLRHVKALQAKEAAEILEPWVAGGHVSALLPTGYVYKTTRAFINNSICQGSDVVVLP